ncbi:hypothetical protein RBB77_09065 [Tunturibacter psychrotolerans]|uniref:Glycosyltransferase RgtA/B/C/D-like domain-containing protein n=1 Tax=Tunturiibacter psychrotolerans TaxID=3069686 RepID=A0AAU7ZVV2_9BACT
MAIETVRVGSDRLESRATSATFNWWYLSLRLLVGAAVMFVGALECRYGKSELYGDDISYLDVANMIRAGDWRAALSPLWSIGYPLLLSVVRRFFASTMRGEMAAVFWLNLSIYFVAWIGFLWLLRLMARSLPGDPLREPDSPLSPFLLICAGCIFVTVQTGVGRVSTVGPDLLVTSILFFASAVALKVFFRLTVGNSVALGVLLGLGLLTKAIFLPLTGVFFGMMVVSQGRRRIVPQFFRAVGVFLLFVFVYGAGLSWSLGRPTLGEAGALNFAFHVNHLSHWMGWQGGPPEFGSPIHPVRMLRNDPPVFAFSEPFHVTYPPQFNMVYWYEGYRQVFSLKNTAHAVVGNLHDLKYVFQEILPVTLAVVVCFCIAFVVKMRTRADAAPSLNPWIVYLPSLVGFSFFLLVHIEGRYVAGFLCMIGMAPFLTLDRLPLRSLIRTAAVLLLVAATLFNSSERLHGAVRSAIARTDMQSGGQWAIADYLVNLNLKAGDKVASVAPRNALRCTWAYASRSHIVAAIGNDAFDPESQVQDLHLFFDHPSTQQQVLELFREQGAVAVVATDIPFEVSSPGWQHVPGSQAWVRFLEPLEGTSKH